MTDNNNRSSEHPDKRFLDDKQCNATVYLELSNKLKEKAIVENIGIYRRTNIVITLNHGCKKTIISHISPKWTKTISDFEKQAKRKNLSKDDVEDITNFLDDNYDTVLGILDIDSKDEKLADSDNEGSNEKQGVLTEIEKIRADNRNMTLDEWRKNLEEKYNHLRNTVGKNLPNLWPALEFELSILNIRTAPSSNQWVTAEGPVEPYVLADLYSWLESHSGFTNHAAAASARLPAITSTPSSNSTAR